MQRLTDDLDELYVTGSSPHDECGLSNSPAGSPLVVRTAADIDSPQGSTVMPRQPLTRVSSGFMDIPGVADGEEDVRSPLVGPSQLPHLAAAVESPVLCQADDATPRFDAADGSGTPRKFGPNDFSILSLVGQARGHSPSCLSNLFPAVEFNPGSAVRTQGAFGKVFQVQRRDDGRIFALKVMKKSVVLEKQQTEYMRTERDVLTRVVHPYIVTLHASFQTPNKLYLVLDFINGGHLFFQLYRAGIFDEPLARIYAAEIVLALKHLHELGIVHRDLKARPGPSSVGSRHHPPYRRRLTPTPQPENILLDAEGHIRITDFGLAAIIRDGSRNNSLVGTIDCACCACRPPPVCITDPTLRLSDMAPEIIAGSGHSKAADWWSLGVLVFEMLTGSAPFRAKNRSMLQKKILSEKVKMPPFLSTSAHRLLTAFLQRDEVRHAGF